jgi:hypothetical protein
LLLPHPATPVAASVLVFANEGCAVHARIGKNFCFVVNGAPPTNCVPANTRSKAVCSLVGADVEDLICGAHCENGLEERKVRLERSRGLWKPELAEGGLGYG